jgi:mono/diheme cytochrome c family protein
VARGAVIFHAMCESCHRPGDAQRVSGGKMEDVPEFLGVFYAANITLHETAGIGKMSDEEIARIIRYGVNKDKKITVMNAFGMSDSDLAAVLGFMRSGDPLFEPDPNVVPKSEPSFMGKIIIGNTVVVPTDRPASGVTMPSKEDKLAYGRYLAHDVSDCAGCHTAGFDPAKVNGPDAFGGGFEFVDRSGATVYSTNISFHETGLGKWSMEDFAKGLREGVRPAGGGSLRYPMPKFVGLPDEDVAALYEYLKSVPAVASKVPAK